ncbi:MazG-like family protein [Leptospira santarosai]|uniref:MazG-like family protein n=1 Tax=Leptospira santarosai TaxID=28183 RepID=UPI000477CCCB|nr:MazG-like family protein [Leptospira santarosai]
MKTSSREKILNEVCAEREKQDLKWGEQNHEPMEWCPILGEEVGEVNKAALEAYFGYKEKGNYSEYRKELIQVAAVAIAMIESLGRNQSKENLL